jgi:NAD(P)-dependent dehydrogenase (short-subunit alcohol dehydrogenase family)
MSSSALSVSDSKVPIRPSRNLAGRVALVTGAGSVEDEIGNGRAISILLAEDEASVVCVDRDLSAAERTAAIIVGEGKGDAVAIQGDVTSEDDCRRIVDAALTRFGRLDILVNNVGSIGARGAAPEVDLADWERSLKLNVTSMMLMAKFAIPAMGRNEPGDGNIRGSIVNMGSVAGLQGGTPSLLYPTSKGAVVNMTRAMAAQHARDGVRVNCVCPGNQFPS